MTRGVRPPAPSAYQELSSPSGPRLDASQGLVASSGQRESGAGDATEAAGGRAEAGAEAEAEARARADGPRLREVLLLDDARFDAHAPVAYHPERPERLTAARSAMRTLGSEGLRQTAVTAREASDDELARAHAPEFLEALERLRGQTGFLDPDTYVAPGSVGAAKLAAGGLVQMIDAVLDGPLKQGVALTRPPGHHATPNHAMGFCLLNNVAIAAAHAKRRGLSRVAILDWDVHHGNGTQDVFWRDPNVLYASLHQFPFYPGTGAAGEIGEAEGRGYTVNVPLGAHGTDAVYRGAFERVILPVLDEYKPELVLISAGFDASARDPLAQMELTASAFGWMAKALRGVADRHSEGRVVMVLEGGYDLVALESGLEAAVRGMMGVEPLRRTSGSGTREVGSGGGAGDGGTSEGRGAGFEPGGEELLAELDHPDVNRAVAEARTFWGKTL